MMCWNRQYGWFFLVLCLVKIHAFVVVDTPLRVSTSLLRQGADSSSSSPASAEDQDSMDNMVNGAPLVLQNQDERSRLASAFAALNEGDQYDAVLTGLCAKILDSDESVDHPEMLKDPLDLLGEMNARKVKAAPRSLMALIDACGKTHDARAMANVMSQCLKNGGISEYGVYQSEIMALPSSPTTRVKCPDGTTKTRQERLEGLPDVPTDERGIEVLSALAASGVIGFCGVCNVLGFNDITPYTNLLLSAIIGLGVLDNFYDVVKGIVNLAKSQVEAIDDKVEVPEKENLPLSIGTGQVTGTVTRGLARLLIVDTERECSCEAAAFFAAYSLGLPCFAFRPNALEAAVLVLESMKQEGESKLDPLLSNVGILKVLIWLMAPVAMESSKHSQLIVSDPREGAGFLKRLEDKSPIEIPDIWQNQEEDLLKWAYAEADLLLRQHKDLLTELTERLAGGAATVGDCVAVMEKW